VSRPLRELLEEQNLSPVQAKLWAHFIETAFAALRRAHIQLTKEENWNSFRQKVGATSINKKDGSVIPAEESLTAELCDFLDNIRKSAGPDDAMRSLEITFQAEKLIKSPKRAGKHRRKVDIFIGSNIGGGAPELAIEAKLLLNEKHIETRYLGEDGIGCFTTIDSPYTHGPIAAMLAYVISMGEQHWLDRIRKALELPPLIAEACEHAVVEGETLPTLCSRLQRTELGLESILILHMIMRFEMATPLAN
jgi:hypothetical protein